MFTQKLKQLRTEAGLTQKDLSEKLFVTPQAISRWENGEVEPSIYMVEKIADIFGVSVDVLLGKTAKPMDKEIVYVEREKEQPSPVLAVCQKCNRPIYESSEIVRSSRRSGRRTKRTIMCRSCADTQLEAKIAYKNKVAKNTRIKSFWGGGIVSIFILFISLYFSISANNTQGIIASIILSILSFTLVSSLILGNNFLGEMMFTIFTWGFVKLPGLIFGLSLDGIIWFLTVKLALYFMGFILTITFGLLALTLGLALSIIVYPFALRKNIRNPQVY